MKADIAGRLPRVLLFARSLDAGGAERQLVNLAVGLQRRGADVRVLLFYGGGVLTRELEAAGVPVETLGKTGRWEVLGFLARFVGAVRRAAPDVVYSMLETPNALAAIMRRRLAVPKMIWGVRSSTMDVSQYDGLFAAVYYTQAFLSRFADAIVFNSRAGLTAARSRGFENGSMHVVNNGIDTARFVPDRTSREAVRAEWGIDDDEILVGLPARVDPVKDHPNFIRAAGLAAKRNHRVKFVCIGGGRREALERLAAEEGLGSRLVWAGERPDPERALAALDVAVLCSRAEGFPNVVAEAMSCGVPCVVTDVGDAALIVGTTGIAVPPGRPEALAMGMEAMIARLETERDSLARAARERIVTNFGLDAMIDRTLAVFEEVAR